LIRKIGKVINNINNYNNFKNCQNNKEILKLNNYKLKQNN